MYLKTTSILLLSCIFAFAQTIDSKRFEMVDLGKNINTPYDESAPIITPDGNTLYFFVANHPENNFGTDNSQDIWFSTRGEDGNWTKAQHMDKPFNIHQFNQVMSVSTDGNTLLLRGGSRKNKKGFCLVRRVGNEWSELEELEVEGYEEMERGMFSGGFLSYDGQVLLLYFTERPNGQYSDIYVSKKISDNKFGKPVMLKEPISTYRDEFGMYLHPDNRTMYFASNRDGGYGSMDIYVTERLDDTWLNWSEPENAGPPVSTPDFDAYFSIDANGNAFTTRTYTSADGGTLDILGLSEKDPVITVAGYVIHQQTREAVRASLTLNDPSLVPALDDQGYYSVKVKNQQSYVISASSLGFLSASVNISTQDIFSDTTLLYDIEMIPEQRSVALTASIINKKTAGPVNATATVDNENIKAINGVFTYQWIGEEDLAISILEQGYVRFDTVISAQGQENDFSMVIPLIPIEMGTTVKINNIFFDFDRTTLQKSSFSELDRLIEFLNDNPGIQVEIGGHTDSQGSESYNQQLSQGRAEAVRTYLIDNGIDKTRISAKGYGENQPVTSNETEEGRAANRRVEFKVIGLE